MTYRRLRKYLQEMDDLKLDDPAIIYNETKNEFAEVKYLMRCTKEDELEDQFVIYT